MRAQSATSAIHGRIRRVLPAFLLVLFFCFSSHAQHYSFSQFGQTDGLLNLDVSALAQDKQGVLWVGTENGLFRADGTHFSSVPGFRDAEYGLVLAMHVDAQDRVWVLGTKHLVYFDKNLTLHEITDLQVGLLLEGGAGLTSLPQQRNTVYLLRGGRLERIHSDDGAHWSVRPVFPGPTTAAYPSLSKLSSLVADPGRGFLWMGCDRALCSVNPDMPASPHVWGREVGVASNDWSSLLLTRDGRLWARGVGDVIRLDPDGRVSSRFGDPSGGSAPELQNSLLLEAGDGAILANVPDGVMRLRGREWQAFTSANGLPPSQISAMFLDRSGGLWLAPEGGGLWRWLGYENWQHWTRSEGLSGNVVWNMLRDRKGELWVAATDNLDLLDEAQGKVLTRGTGSDFHGTETIAADSRGHLWAGTNMGRLIDFNPATRQANTVAADLKVIYRVQSVGAGSGERIWVCSAQGVGYLSAEDGWKTLHRVEDAGAPTGTAWGVTEDRSGTLWFSAAGGIYRLQKNQWSHIQFPNGSNLIDYPALAAAPDGTFWIQAAMPRPLLHLRMTGERAEIIGDVPGSMIGTDDISFILADRRGWLWVGTDLGVYVNNGKRWVQCTQEDGLISDDTNTAGILEDKDDSMWFGTAAGLSHLLHPEVLFNAPVPRVNVRDIRLNGNELQSGEILRIHHQDPQLTAELFSTFYERPRAVVFQYKLQPLQNQWQTAASGSLRFNGLPPGDYTLSVEALDRRAHATSAPISYRFTLLPPWYQRDRVKMAAIVLTLLLIAVGWRINVRQLRASEATLKRKVDRQTAQLLAEKEELQRTQRELVETARRDALTGLLNRSAIFQVLAEMQSAALESNTMLSVIMADLDHFKSINDRYGHAAGDAVLRECADRFRATLRPGDAVGRYGGEELLIIIPGLQPSHSIARVEAIREAVASRPVAYRGEQIPITCSFGVAWLDADRPYAEIAVQAADAALYQAKQDGRDRVAFASESPVAALQAR